MMSMMKRFEIHTVEPNNEKQDAFARLKLNRKTRGEWKKTLVELDIDCTSFKTFLIGLVAEPLVRAYLTEYTKKKLMVQNKMNRSPHRFQNTALEMEIERMGSKYSGKFIERERGLFPEIKYDTFVYDLGGQYA